MSEPGPIEETLPTSAEPVTATGPTSSRRMIRWVALVAWLMVIVAWTLRLRATGTSPFESLQGLVDRLDGAWWAIPAYIAVYTVRPLVLFPASLLTVAGGLLFGPVAGLGAAVVGANLSALVAFRLGRVFSPAALTDGEGATVLARWSGRLREQSFMTVMIMRLALIPFDLVNYAAGFLRIETAPFLAATAIGSLPGAVSFVLAALRSTVSMPASTASTRWCWPPPRCCSSSALRWPGWSNVARQGHENTHWPRSHRDDHRAAPPPGPTGLPPVDRDDRTLASP